MFQRWRGRKTPIWNSVALRCRCGDEVEREGNLGGWDGFSLDGRFEGCAAGC